MSVIIAEAVTEDLVDLQPLVRDFVTSFRLEDAAYADSFARIIDNPAACLLVASLDGSLIGYVLGFCHDTFYANGKVAWVEEIMVADSARRQGVGERLMEGFESWSKKQGCVLCALATRRASEFYTALGYEESATYFRKLV